MHLHCVNDSQAPTANHRREMVLSGLGCREGQEHLNILDLDCLETF